MNAGAGERLEPSWSAQSLGTALHLETKGDHFVIESEDYWSFAGRLFGGYAAALAFSAAARRSGDRDPLSMWCRFLEPVRAGPVEIRAHVLARGRSTTALRSEIIQDGAVALTVNAWFGDRRPGEIEGWSGESGGARPPEPNDCPEIFWRQKKNAFDASFERRAIDYPLDRSEFAQRPETIELWLRPNPDEEFDELTNAAIDVMCFDLHMTESAVERPWVSRARSFSYDLAVLWHERPTKGWRRMRYESRPHGGVAACRSWMWSVEGRHVAAAGQQARIGRLEQPSGVAESGVTGDANGRRGGNHE
ncbi:MAG TPA: thioesterase family protein [Acidimicrobiales bacterium]|nr:thioesterase family protein [Acidimicrobiales bacterium]